jgi:hypothetical protein
MTDPHDLHDLLRLCGEALYGQQWQSALARDLGVPLRTMQRWAAGGVLPAALDQQIMRLVGERRNALDALSNAARRLTSKWSADRSHESTNAAACCDL